jgi:hypothetical protein
MYGQAVSPWTFGWDALVAIGTLALAVVTVAVGTVALFANKVARDGLKISQAELQASTFPLIESVPLQFQAQRQASPPDLVDYSSLEDGAPEPEWRYRDVVDVNTQPGGVFLSVPIKNVGPGIARITSPQPRALSVPDVVWTDGVCTRALIPSGEYARLNFKFGGLRDEAYAEVFYSDNSGEADITRVRLYIRSQRDLDPQETGYTVRGTAMYHSDDEIPFAIAGDPKVGHKQPSLAPSEARPLEE